MIRTQTQIHNSAKKANTMPFHWVFVLLAGGAIIVLFTMFINTTKVASESSLGSKVIVHFDTIFSSLATRDGIESNISSHPDIRLEFSCAKEDTTTTSTFRMKGGISKNIDQIALFSQKTVYGDVLFSSIALYDIPFAVGTMVYVTDPNTLYVFSANNPNAPELEQLEKLFATGTTKAILRTTEFNTLADIDLRGYHDVVIIDYGQTDTESQAPLLTRIPSGTEVYLYKVTSPSMNILQEGVVSGFKLIQVGQQRYFESEKQISYTNVDELRGILHSDTIHHAECVLQKAYNNIPRVALILKSRSEILASETTNERCRLMYQGAAAAFSDIASNPTNYKSKAVELDYLNKNLDVQNCIVLY
jgi:hypothetical protein